VLIAAKIAQFRFNLDDVTIDILNEQTKQEEKFDEKVVVTYNISVLFGDKSFCCHNSHLALSK
jgi:hypothetical protein